MGFFRKTNPKQPTTIKHYERFMKQTNKKGGNIHTKTNNSKLQIIHVQRAFRVLGGKKQKLVLQLYQQQPMVSFRDHRSRLDMN